MATKKEEGYSDKIKIKLFKDNDKYKDDVTVGVNGKITKIRRGVWVEVSRPAAEILAHQEEQDIETADYCAQQEEEFRSREKNFT